VRLTRKKLPNPRGRKLLCKFLDDLENIAAWCRHWELSPAYISAIRRGHKLPGILFADKLEQATKGKVPLHSWVEP
jgi:hypothetical protein